METSFASRAESLSYRLPWVVALMIFSALLYQRSKLHAEFRLAYSQQEATAVAASNRYRDQLSVLYPGDSLRSTRIVSAGGDTLPMQRLGERYRLLYFYRPECAACEFISPKLSSLGNQANVAFVRFHRDSLYPPEPRKDHFAMAELEPIGSVTAYRVPTLLVVNSEGVVVASAHSDARKVLRLLVQTGFPLFAEELKRLEASRAAALSSQEAGQSRSEL